MDQHLALSVAIYRWHRHTLSDCVQPASSPSYVARRIPTREGDGPARQAPMRAHCVPHADHARASCSSWDSIGRVARDGRGACRPSRSLALCVQHMYHSIMHTKLCPSQSRDQPGGVSLWPGCSSTCAALTDPYSIVRSHEDGGAPDRHGCRMRIGSRKAAVREGRAGSQSAKDAERLYTLYVLAAAILNLVCARSVPCHAALPGREWQYAWTSPQVIAQMRMVSSTRSSWRP